MTGWFGIAILLAASGSAGPGASQAIRIDAGEFRWWPLHVRKAPSEIICRFEVLHGAGTVHAELLGEHEFRQFVRGRPYDKLIGTPAAANAQFSQIVQDRGDYAVVIMNNAGAPPAIVSMYIETRLATESGGIARTLPPERRLAVILISFAIFFISAGWSGLRLIRAMKNAA